VMHWLPLLAQAERSPGSEPESMGPLFTWLIFMVIWVVIQVQAAKKKKEAKNATPGMENPEAPQGVEAEIRDVMTQLLRGNQARPAPPAPPRPHNHRDKVNTDFSEYVAQVKRPAPAPPPPPLPQPTIEFDPIVEADHTYDLEDEAFNEERVYGGLKDIEDIEVALEGAALTDSQNLINPSNFIVDLATLTVPIMRTQLISQRPVRTKTNHPKLRSSKAVQKAIIARVILGPPSALRGDIFSAEAGEL
jgi:hypothetical protein